MVLLNPVRVSVVPRRSIHADLSFWLQPLLWAAFGKETSNMPASFFQLFHENPGDGVAEDAAGTLWLLLNFFYRHMGGFTALQSKKIVTLTSSHEHKKMASPSLQGRRERSGEENS